MNEGEDSNKQKLVEVHPFDNITLQYAENEASELTKDYVKASASEATLKAYKSDIDSFIAWGGVIPASSHLIANYLADHAERLAVSTLRRRIAALSKAHEVLSLANPSKSEIVKSTMRGIVRKHGSAQRQMSPITKDRLIRIVENCEDDKKGARDKALLLVGFASALRRSELVALNCKDVSFVPEGMILTIKRSKTDQEGEGRLIAIPYAQGSYCPVNSLKHHLDCSGIKNGSIFRTFSADCSGKSRLTGHGVAYVIKQRAIRAGLDPTMFSGHSLRAGFATSAAQSGADTWMIMKQTGHKSEATVRKYIREGELFTVNALSGIL